MSLPETSVASSNDWNRSPQLPFDAVESFVNVREKKNTKAEKKLKRKSDRKSRLSLGVTTHDLHMQEEILPAVNLVLTDVVDHRRQTAHKIDDLEKDVDHLNLQRLANGPVDTEELGEMVVHIRDALAVTRTSENQVQLGYMLQKMNAKISAKEHNLKPNAIKELQDLKEILGAL